MNPKSKVLLALLTTAVAVVALGCTYTPKVAQATPTPPPWGVAGFDKRDVNIGVVPRDQEGIQTFMVLNRGGKPLMVGPATVHVEQGCDAVELDADTTTVQPLNATFLSLQFGKHRQTGPHVVRVDVPSSDLAAPSTSLFVRFDVQEEVPPAVGGPHLSVDKTAIDTGAVPFDWPAYEQFTLRNTGDAALVLEGVPTVRVVRGC